MDYGGAVTDGLIARRDSGGAVDVLRRQLAEPRAPLDSEHRSSERQGDGDVARARAADGRRSWRTASSCRRARARPRRLAEEREWIRVARVAADSGVPDGDRRRATRSRTISATPTCGLAELQRCVPQYGVHRARAGEDVARSVRARGRDRAAVFAPRRPVPVREARAPAIVDALRRDGERERDLLRRRRLPRAARWATASSPTRRRTSGSATP